MKKFVMSFLLLSVLLSTTVFAQDFSVSYEDGVRRDYYASREDYLILTVNNYKLEDWFTVSIFGSPQEWAVVEDQLIRIPSFGSADVRIKIEPSRDALPGIYQYFLKLGRSSNDDVVEEKILIRVKQVTSAIVKDVSLSCKSCLDNVGISGTVFNVGSKPIDVDIVLSVGGVQKTVGVGKIGIGGDRNFEAEFSLEDFLPSEYEIELDVVDASGNNMYSESYVFEIPSIEDVYYSRDVSSTPFGSTITIKAENRGNVVADVELSSENPESWYYFISGPTPSGMFLENYIWESSLQPGDTFAITYSEIYWPVYIFIVAAVLAASVLYWHTSDVEFSKSVLTAKKFKPGQELSVSVKVRSKAEDLKRVTVRDVIPIGFSVVNKFEAAKPVIRKVGAGIELLWDIGRMDPNEERHFHYTVKPVSTNFNRSNLPSATLKAMRRGKFFSKRSNAVSISPEELDTNVVTVQVAN